ncbi:MAG: GIY-YIG nuclease family protein [Boseongicola sp. SB0677_bin_26]|nr:GIY-YIG nuclease family protein [Boseongicola sp. SB0677_bin_26]
MPKRPRPVDNDQEPGSGIVYVLTNEAMPGLVKIGRTTQDDPQVRMDQLYNGATGVPVPFDCVMAVRVEDPRSAEKALHAAFGPQRINPGREFFEIDPAQVAALLDVIGFEDVTPEVKEDNKSIPEAELSASEKLRKRRPNLNFADMGIPVGSVLHAATGDGEIEVVGERKVSFQGQEMSITQATKLYLQRPYPVAPAPYWIYEGRSLSDIYVETYGGWQDAT